MRLPVLFAALALAAAVPGAALAQAAAPAAATGVPVADARAWLIGLGGSVAEPTAFEANQILTVADQPLPWSLTFYNCAGGAALCDDVQFGASFSGAITLEQVNAWNRDNRYLKAIFVPGTSAGEARAFAQYDVMLTAPGTGPLQEPTVVWLQMLQLFAQYLAQTAPPPAGG